MLVFAVVPPLVGLNHRGVVLFRGHSTRQCGDRQSPGHSNRPPRPESGRCVAGLFIQRSGWRLTLLFKYVLFLVVLPLFGFPVPWVGWIPIGGCSTSCESPSPRFTWHRQGYILLNPDQVLIPPAYLVNFCRTTLCYG